MTEEGQEGRNSYQQGRRARLLEVPEATLNPRVRLEDAWYPRAYHQHSMTDAVSAMGGPRIWLMAARPRTLPAAIAPVLVGTRGGGRRGRRTSAGAPSSPR